LPPLLAAIAILGLLAWHLLRLIRKGQHGLFAAMLEARTASRVKSEFLANMSHELRTPLNGVIGIAQILKRTRLTDDQRDLLDHLATAADDQLAIVNDLLDMGRIEAGGLELSEETFDPASVVRDAVTLIAPKADEKGLELRLALPDESAAVIGDAARFKQIVLNLLSNSVKFTNEGTVSVTLTGATVRDHEELVLVVADTGIGITRENQTRIFERFMQVDPSTKRKAQGSGLGLAICKALVDAMHGSIELISTPGVGTSVSISLNLRRAVSGTDTMMSVA
jgi:signal transduction histidine kinase